MLTKIGVKNFKPFGEVEGVRLAPITLIYGPNSSGKSSLVQSLLLMSQTVNGQQRNKHSDLITRGSLIDLGNFSSIQHRHIQNKLVKFDYEFDNSGSSSTNSRFARNGVKNPFLGVSIGFSSMQLSPKQSFPIISSFGINVVDFYGEKLDVRLFRPGLTNPVMADFPQEEEIEECEDDDIRDLIHGSSRFDRDGVFKFINQAPLEKFARFAYEFGHDYPIRRAPNPNGTQKIQSPDDPDSILRFLKEVELRRGRFRPLGSEFLPATPIFHESNAADEFKPGVQVLSEILRIYDRSFKNTLGSISYLGPLRTHPARHYMLDGVPGDSVGTRGEQAVQILYHDLEAGNGTSPLLTRLNEYCVSFDIPYKFDLRNLGDAVTGDVIVLSLTDTRTNIRVGPADVGFGVGQLLPILLEGILVNERGDSSKIVCVEQPEIHLHPRLQAAMADFFIDTSLTRTGHRSRSTSTSGFERRSRVQWILETHSEALILRLQRRIREKQLSHEDICVLYVEPRGEKGSVIQELRLDEDGEFIDLWPDGFFVESLSEILGGR